MIAQRNPVYSVLLLIASFGALSGLYVMLDAPFVAHGNVATAGGCLSSHYLAAWMIARGGSLRDAEEAIRIVERYVPANRRRIQTQPTIESLFE